MSSHPPDTPALRRGFAVVDVETSGLDPARHRVIEVAVTQLDPTGRSQREWSSLVRVPGSTGPVHVHGLTSESLKDAPNFADIAPQLADLLRDRILVAHNAAFDWSFLAMEARRSRIELPVSERLCTWHLAKALQLPTSNLRLGTLAEHWGIPVDQAHRAGDDVRVLVQVLGHCLDEAAQAGTPLPLEPCAPLSRWWRLAALRHRARREWRRHTRRVRHAVREFRGRNA